MIGYARESSASASASSPRLRFSVCILVSNVSARLRSSMGIWRSLFIPAASCSSGAPVAQDTICRSPVPSKNGKSSNEAIMPPTTLARMAWSAHVVCNSSMTRACDRTECCHRTPSKPHSYNTSWHMGKKEKKPTRHPKVLKKKGARGQLVKCPSHASWSFGLPLLTHRNLACHVVVWLSSAAVNVQQLFHNRRLLQALAHHHEHGDHAANLVPEKRQARDGKLTHAKARVDGRVLWAGLDGKRKDATTKIGDTGQIHLAEISKVVLTDKVLRCFLHFLQIHGALNKVILVLSIQAAESGVKVEGNGGPGCHPNVRR
eukprot:m.110704 g.110704  ORF g.110704 m.110704 type:complete len:317 (+) comp16071_c0_seq1:106-1056(+)